MECMHTNTNSVNKSYTIQVDYKYVWKWMPSEQKANICWSFSLLLELWEMPSMSSPKWLFIIFCFFFAFGFWMFNFFASWWYSQQNVAIQTEGWVHFAGALQYNKLANCFRSNWILSIIFKQNNSCLWLKKMRRLLLLLFNNSLAMSKNSRPSCNFWLLCFESWR